MHRPPLSPDLRQRSPVLSALLLCAFVRLGPVAFAGTPETAVAPSEPVVAPEVNPPGDIPDSQVFVRYTSASGGFALKVPEGWARTESPTSVATPPAATAPVQTWVRWIDKLDGVVVTVAPATATPTSD